MLALLQPACNATFGKTIEENIEKIKSYKLSEADRYFQNIDSQNAVPKTIFKGPGTSNIEVPTIVTGSSSNHFLESLEMLRSLDEVVRPEYRAIEVFYYDLGLERAEHQAVKNSCNCTVVKFPFEMYPAHVRRLKGYSWKPIIVKMMLQIRQFVMWMDASIQFTGSNLDPLFIQAKQHGVMMWHNVWSLPAHIHQDTFNFLEETPYKDFTEYHAGLVLFHNSHKIVKNYILDPWVKCALIEECMMTKHDELELLECPNHTTFHVCHSFDQAILSLLIQ